MTFRTPPFLTALAMLVFAVVCSPCRADTSEYTVKAAFVYNFTQFVEWPADAFQNSESEFVIGIVGDSPMTTALTGMMAGKVVGSHPITVRHFDSVDTIGSCDVLFVPETLDAGMPAILSTIGKSPCLLVGEGNGFLPAGGAIRLFLEESKMRFQLDPDAIQRARLKASAKLMKLARLYKR